MENRRAQKPLLPRGRDGATSLVGGVFKHEPGATRECTGLMELPVVQTPVTVQVRSATTPGPKKNGLPNTPVSNVAPSTSRWVTVATQ